MIERTTLRIPLAGTPSARHRRWRGHSHSSPAMGLAWWCCVASLFCVLLGNFGGTIAAYAFLAFWILLAATRPKAGLRALTLNISLWLFPGFAVMSCLWSQQHAISLRFGLQYAATVGCAALAARLLPPRQFVHALLVSLMAVAMLCLAIGRSDFNQLTQTVDFIGVFESKNELAFFISLLLLAGVAVAFDRGSGAHMRLLAVASFAPAVPLLIKAHSATSLVTTVVAVVVLLGNCTLAQLGPRERARILLAGTAMFLPLLTLGGSLGAAANHFVAQFLGRSGTMTGRTVLWQRALELIPQHSLLGWGWQAFWVRNSADAEGLWNKFHIAGRQGFQFQNTFLEAAVELGWVGCTLLAMAMLIALWRTIRWSWRDHSPIASFFVALMVCLMILSIVEVDVLYQFSIGAFVFFAAACLASDRGRAIPAARPAASPRSANSPGRVAPTLPYAH